MMKKYLYLILTLLVLCLIVLGLPGKRIFRESGEEILSSVDLRTHIISEQRFKEMHARDPGLQLVDLRDREAFARGSLPGALNLPAEDLDTDDIIGFFRGKGHRWVLYAEKSYEADKYWILFTQMGLEHLFVLETGPRLDLLIQHWDDGSSRVSTVDEIPTFTFRPDSTVSF